MGDSVDEEDDDIDVADIDLDNDDDSITLNNQQLEQVIDFYDCYDLLPLAERIIWLSNVKEALGYIPPSFNITRFEIKLLVVLQEEQSKKMAYSSYKMREEQRRQQASSTAKATPSQYVRRYR